jgi:hypothetical protein
VWGRFAGWFRTSPTSGVRPRSTEVLEVARTRSEPEGDCTELALNIKTVRKWLRQPCPLFAVGLWRWASTPRFCIESWWTKAIQ